MTELRTETGEPDRRRSADGDSHPEPGRDAGRDRDTDRDRGRPRERETEHRQLRLDFNVPDNIDGREIVERLVRDIRGHFSAGDQRPRDEQQPARRASQARQRDRSNGEPTDRRRHLESAIEHAQAAGLHDLAQELRRHLHQPQPGRRPRIAAPHQPRHPDPRGERDERIGHLTRLMEEMHKMLRDSHEHNRNAAAIGHGVDEAHRDRNVHFEHKLHELEQVVHEVANRVENSEREIANHLENLERLSTNVWSTWSETSQIALSTSNTSQKTSTTVSTTFVNTVMITTMTMIDDCQPASLFAC